MSPGPRRVRLRDTGSESEFRRAVLVEVLQLRQLVLALAVAKPPRPPTFGELAADWLRRIALVRVCPANELRHIRHLAPLSGLREGELTKGMIDTLLGGLRRPRGALGPSSVNKLRSTGKLIIEDAQACGLWRGPNPFSLVRRAREPERLYNTFTVGEVNRILPKLVPDRRRLAKTVLLIGIRPGEALGLLKTSVDLKRKVIKIHRSHGRDQTKTGKEREFPIPDALVPDLRAAIAESPSQWVFPRPDGRRQREDTKLTYRLRTAMKKARVCTGYGYSCRRKGCRYRDQRNVERREARCPKCNFKLWIEPIPKSLRFYDLRHSCATLHHEHGCDPLVIQRMLGHHIRSTSGRIYTHLSEAYLRKEVNRLSLSK